jgi:hypothetical protein
MENDEKYYDIVAREIRENRINDAIWTKAIAESGGEENRTKAVYIQLRVKQLMRDEIKSQYDAPAEAPPEAHYEPAEDWEEMDESGAGADPMEIAKQLFANQYVQLVLFLIGIFAIWKWLWPWAQTLRGTFR